MEAERGGIGHYLKGSNYFKYENDMLKLISFLSLNIKESDCRSIEGRKSDIRIVAGR